MAVTQTHKLNKLAYKHASNRTVHEKKLNFSTGGERGNPFRPYFTLSWLLPLDHLYFFSKILATALMGLNSCTVYLGVCVVKNIRRSASPESRKG